VTRTTLAALALSASALGVACDSPPAKRLTNDAASTAVKAAAAPRPAASAPGTARLAMIEATPDSDAPSTIRTKRLEAKAADRVLVVYVGATWCEPCQQLKREIASGRLDERFSRLTLLAFDADADADRLGAAGYVYRFVPYVALPGPDGRPSDAQQATGQGQGAWRELLGKLDAWQRRDAAR
jgi:thiol-disulfide isomerase/thioredoxin